MPEGDTILRAATTLRRALQGREILRVWSREPAPLLESSRGKLVQAVESRGKHLLLILDPGEPIVHSHLGMDGAWHLYDPGQPWTRPRSWAVFTLEVQGTLAVLLRPKTFEVLSAVDLRRHRWLSRLGPDLLGSVWDESTMLSRFRFHDPTSIGEAVMNQSIVCGIGNVYKSETLFLERTNPFRTVGELDDAQILRIVKRASILMRRNTIGNRRTTRFRTTGGSRSWVYERSGEPCHECGARIEMRRQGDLGRSTYYCPTCQQV